MSAAVGLSEADLRTCPEDVFTVMGSLGEGAFGQVMQAIHNTTKESLAVKMVPLGSSLKELVKEIVIMRQCECENIVRYYGSYHYQGALWIVMEHCSGGSVSDILKKMKLDEDAIRGIVYGAVQGLLYLHDQDKIHRDIKASNILLTNQGVVKLGDFGVSGQLSSTLRKRNSCVGTPYWMSPEIIQQQEYDTSTDIWSLGVTCIEMGDRVPPLAEVFPMRALFLIPINPSPSLRKPEDFSQDLSNFISTSPGPSHHAIINTVEAASKIASRKTSLSDSLSGNEDESDGEDDYRTVVNGEPDERTLVEPASPSQLVSYIPGSHTLVQATLTNAGDTSQANKNTAKFSSLGSPQIRPRSLKSAAKDVNGVPFKDLNRNSGLAPGPAPLIVNSSSGTFSNYDTASAATMIVHDDSTVEDYSTMIRHPSEIVDDSFKTCTDGNTMKKFDLSDTMVKHDTSVVLRSPDGSKVKKAEMSLAQLKQRLQALEEEKEAAILATQNKFKLQRDILSHELRKRNSFKPPTQP